AKFRRMRIPKTAVALVAGLALGWVVADASSPPPVLKDLGQVNPTPVPTEKDYREKRLITSLTLQNSPQGETVLTFEASDVGQARDGKFRPIASQRYSLGDVKAGQVAQRQLILRNLRGLEEALLGYVQMVGGPREHIEKAGEKRPD